METISRFALTFLLNAAWQILLIAIVTRLCDKLLCNLAARQRHWLWVTAFVLCLLLPLLSTVDLFQNVGTPTAARDMIAIQVEATDAPPLSPPSTLTHLLRNRPRTFSPTPILTGLALMCHLLSLLFHAVSFVRAWRRTQMLLAHAEMREISEPLAAIKARCQQAFGLSEIALRYSPEIACPVTVGKRTVLWPEQLSNATSPEVLTAALGHEIAHLRRWDYALNVLYEILSLPIAFHPAVTFIKRQIQHTRELACDEMATAALLDAPTYARSLLVLARTVTEFRRPTFSLGVFDADILEERIMKLIEPRLQKRTSIALLLTAVFMMLLSSALAAVCALNVEQSGAQALAGEWEMYMRENGRDPKGTMFEFPVGLRLQVVDNELRGEVTFPAIQGEGDQLEKVGEGVSPLKKIKFSGNELSFTLESPDQPGGEFLSMKLRKEGETLQGTWEISQLGESGTVKVRRKPKASQIEKIVGEWTVFAGDGAKSADELPTLIVKAEGNKLTAKTVFNLRGEKKEWVLIDPKFDGETFLFKADNGEEILEGKLKWMGDHFEGPWKGSQSGASGTMKLVRKR